MSDRDPNVVEPIPAPVSEVEAEIKAEIAAEVEAEMSDLQAPGVPDDGRTGGDWSDPPPPVADPAAEVLAWLRGEFDDVNANLRSLTTRLARQEEAIQRITASEEEELNSSLAELEGCSAQLRNEAATLRGTHTQLAVSLPGLVADAVQSAVATTVDSAVAELRASVAQLGAALSEALPAAVAEALAPTWSPPDDQGSSEEPGPADGDGTDLVTQLHDAQDEAAEWFSIVVDEAVRRAVERWLAPMVSPPAGTGVDAPEADPAPQGHALKVAALQVAAPQVATGPPPPPPPPAENSSPQDKSPSGDADPSGDTAPSGDADPSDATTTAVVADTAGGEEAAAQAVVERPPDDVAAVAGADELAVGRESELTCVLPGVAVGPTLAMGVSAALGRARLRRRRRRRAGAPAAGLFRHDPFAGDLTRRLERFALARRGMAWSPNGASPADSGDTTSETPPPSSLVAVAERDGHELVIDLATGPLALVGPAAHDAGRALVTTFLATNGPGAGRVIAAGSLLPPGPPFPGLERVDELAPALDRFEAEIVRRHGAPTHLDDEPLVVLVVAAVAPEQADRLVDLARRGRSLRATVLVVGESAPGATTVTLEPGAAVRGVSPPGAAPDLVGSRMFGLALGPTSELLDLLAAARSDDDVTPVVDVADEPFPVLVGAGPTAIKVRVLGPYRIDVGGSEIRSGLRAKARELLAFYLIHPEGTTLDVATEALWPEADPGRGSEWFWTALGNLRSLFRSVTGTKALKVIERDADRYRIEGVFDVDLWRFQAALPPVGASTDDPEWAAALESAADLYGGELLADVDWAWAEVPREDLRRRSVDVLVSLAATRLAAADVGGALDVLSHAVEVDPLAEQLYRRIMRLHAKQFRPDEVEATFRRLKARLGELDLQPSVESERLVQELVK